MSQLLPRLKRGGRPRKILLGLALAELALFSALAILLWTGLANDYSYHPPPAGPNCGVDSCFDRGRVLLGGLISLYIVVMVAPLLLQLLILAWSRDRGRVYCAVLQQLQLVALISLLFTDYRYLVPLGAVLPVAVLLSLKWVGRDHSPSGVKRVS
jgi:hypothetical protein